MKTRYKYFLFTLQGFEEFATTEYLGSDQILFVAIDGRMEANPIFVKKELKVEERKSSEVFHTKSLELAKELDLRLGNESEAYVLISKDPRFLNFKHKDLKCIFLEAHARESEDFVLAKNLALKVFSYIRELETLEEPRLFLEPPCKILKDANIEAYKNLIDFSHPQLQALVDEKTRKKKLLVHICCGPDAAGVIEQLKHDYELLCFWYDPNIQPKEEYDRRLEAFVTVAEKENIPYVVGEYDVENFFDRIKGLEYSPEQGAKCTHCYDMRLERAAFEAQKQNCDAFTTSLAISPHKVQQKLKAFGEIHGAKYEIPYMAKNFMKAQGFKSSVEYSKIYNIYRQDYCGCYYSMHEGGPIARKEAKRLGYLPEIKTIASQHSEVFQE